MRLIGRIVLTVLLICSAATAWAGSPARLGTTGALELLIPTDARGVAMGGAIMAENQGAQSWFWNPAGAASIEGNEVSVARRAYIADIDLNNFSYARQMGDAGVLGLSAKILSSPNDIVYTNEFPNGTGETFSSSFVVVGASYARTLTDRVSFGVNGHYIAEQIYRETAHGVAFDIGFTYRPTWNGVTLGVAIKNYGPKMSFDGPDLEIDNDDSDDHASTQSASFELPSFMQFGVAWNAWQNSNQNVNLAGTFQANNFSEDEFRVGGEWAFSEQFFLRSGYSGSSQTAYPFGFSAGAGLRIPIGDSQTRLDYAWTDAGIFGSNHLFTVTLGF
jgi:hypothetical protein